MKIFVCIELWCLALVCLAFRPTVNISADMFHAIQGIELRHSSTLSVIHAHPWFQQHSYLYVTNMTRNVLTVYLPIGYVSRYLGYQIPPHSIRKAEILTYHTRIRVDFQ
jgi:hypothetical protein